MIFNLMTALFPEYVYFYYLKGKKKCTLCVQECESHNPELFINIVTGIHNPLPFRCF